MDAPVCLRFIRLFHFHQHCAHQHAGEVLAALFVESAAGEQGKPGAFFVLEQLVDAVSGNLEALTHLEDEYFAGVVHHHLVTVTQVGELLEHTRPVERIPHVSGEHGIAAGAGEGFSIMAGS